MIELPYNIDQSSYFYMTPMVQVGTISENVNYPKIKLPIDFDYGYYSQQISNYDICNDIRRLFKEKAYIYDRLMEMFDDDDIAHDRIRLNKQSFLSFSEKIDNIKRMFSSYVIGITNDGCIAIQYDNSSKYVYIKFSYEDNIFYNLYAKHKKVFDIVKTGTFSDLEADYEKLCFVVA